MVQFVVLLTQLCFDPKLERTVTTLELTTDPELLRLTVTSSEPLFCRPPREDRYHVRAESLVDLGELFKRQRTDLGYALVMFFGSISGIRVGTPGGDRINVLEFQVDPGATSPQRLFDGLCIRWDRPYRFPGHVELFPGLKEFIEYMGISDVTITTKVA